MIYTELRKAKTLDAHVVSVLKVEDRKGRIAGTWFYDDSKKYSTAKLCCYPDEGIKNHSMPGNCSRSRLNHMIRIMC